MTTQLRTLGIALAVMISACACASHPKCKPRCPGNQICRWAWEESSGPFGTSTSHGPAECRDAQNNPLPSPSSSPHPVVCYIAPGPEWRCVTYSEEKSCCVVWTRDPPRTLFLGPEKLRAGRALHTPMLTCLDPNAGADRRSRPRRNLFLRMIGITDGRVPEGYAVNHIVPLRCGGCDVPSNMELLTVKAWTARTGPEQYDCGRHPGGTWVMPPHLRDQ